MNNAMGCTGMGAYSVLSHRGRSAVVILGEVDAMKFRSCLTLFAEVAPDEKLWLVLPGEGRWRDDLAA